QVTLNRFQIQSNSISTKASHNTPAEKVNNTTSDPLEPRPVILHPLQICHTPLAPRRVILHPLQIRSYSFGTNVSYNPLAPRPEILNQLKRPVVLHRLQIKPRSVVLYASAAN
ncbi:hypothetical protein CHS0354_004718, partial [Potamilus streckersoni]